MKTFKEVYDCDSITINVTNACNLSCSYCFEHDKDGSMMSKETAIKIIDESYNLIDPVRGKFTINIFGGEPLLNWDTIKAVIDHCNENRYEVKYGITTNLTMLTDEMIEYIDDNSIMMLVSIDGTKKVHDKNRCGSHSVAVSNLKKLVDHHLEMFVEARMTILPEDVPYALRGVKELIEFGINNICPMLVTDVKWEPHHLKNLRAYYTVLFEYYLSLLNDKDMKRNISIKNTDEILCNVLEPEIEDSTMCPIGSNKWCSFDTNGDIYPCHQGPTSEEPFKTDLLMGNIYTGVDESKLVLKPKVNDFDLEKCKNCVGKSICKGGCPTQNMRETGVYNEPSQGYCDTMIILYEVAVTFRERIITASNIRNRMLNVLIENLKVKHYLDDILMSANLKDNIGLPIKIMHFQDMYERLDNKVIPSFDQYFKNKIAIMASYILAERGIEYGEQR